MRYSSKSFYTSCRGQISTAVYSRLAHWSILRSSRPHAFMNGNGSF